MQTNLKQGLVAVGLAIFLPDKPIHATHYINIEAADSNLLAGGKIIESQGTDFHFAIKWDVGKDIFFPDIFTAEAHPGHKSSLEFIMKLRSGSGTPGEHVYFDLFRWGDTCADVQSPNPPVVTSK